MAVVEENILQVTHHGDERDHVNGCGEALHD